MFLPIFLSLNSDMDSYKLPWAKKVLHLSFVSGMIWLLLAMAALASADNRSSSAPLPPKPMRYLPSLQIQFHCKFSLFYRSLYTLYGRPGSVD